MDVTASIPFTLGVVNDEISQDPKEAAEGAKRLGLTSLEVNSLWGKQVHELTDDEARRAAAIFADAFLPVIAVCPPLLKPVFLPANKAAFRKDVQFQEHLAILDRALGLTRVLKGPDGGPVPFVRTFSFRKTGMVGLGNPSTRHPNGGVIAEEILDLIAEGLRRAVERAEDCGVTLVLENVRSCWGNSGTNAARIIERVNLPALRALWDPANAFVSGETFPTGWQAIRGFVAHVHLKDASVADSANGMTRWERIGKGQACIAEELRALWEMPYRGAVHVETHWKPEDGSNGTRATYEGLLALLNGLGVAR